VRHWKESWISFERAWPDEIYPVNEKEVKKGNANG
jgi:hypothetical protein